MKLRKYQDGGNVPQMIYYDPNTGEDVGYNIITDDQGNEILVKFKVDSQGQILEELGTQPYDDTAKSQLEGMFEVVPETEADQALADVGNVDRGGDMYRGYQPNFQTRNFNMTGSNYNPFNTGSGLYNRGSQASGTMIPNQGNRPIQNMLRGVGNAISNIRAPKFIREGINNMRANNQARRAEIDRVGIDQYRQDRALDRADRMHQRGERQIAEGNVRQGNKTIRRSNRLAEDALNIDPRAIHSKNYADEMSNVFGLREQKRDKKFEKKSLKKKDRLARKTYKLEGDISDLNADIEFYDRTNPVKRQAYENEADRAYDYNKMNLENRVHSSNWNTMNKDREDNKKFRNYYDRTKYLGEDRRLRNEANAGLRDIEVQNEIQANENRLHNKYAKRRFKDSDNFGKRLRRAQDASENIPGKVNLESFYDLLGERTGFVTDREAEFIRKRNQPGTRQYGGYIPKAQVGLGFTPEGFNNLPSVRLNPNATSLSDRMVYGDNPNVYQSTAYNMNSGNPLKLTDRNFSGFQNMQTPNIKSNTPQPTQQPGQAVNPTSSSPGFNNRNLSYYGNRLQNTGLFIPAGYNLAKYAMDKPMKQQVINPNWVMQQKTVTPNYQPIYRQENQLRQDIRNNSRGTGQMLANLQQANANMVAAKSDAAFKNKMVNLQEEKAYEAQRQAFENQKAQERKRVEQANIQHQLSHEQLGSDAATQLGKAYIQKGILHNSELQDFIKLQTYVNQISPNYKVEPKGDGTFEIIHTGSGAAMSPDQFQMYMQQNSANNQNFTTTKVDPNAPVVEANKQRYGGKIKKMKKRNRLM